MDIDKDIYCGFLFAHWGEAASSCDEVSDVWKYVVYSVGALAVCRKCL
jgi:hypothetical protein